MIKQKDLEQILKKNKILDDKQLKDFSAKAKKAGLNLENFLLDNKVLAPDLLYQAAAEFYAVPFIDLKNVSMDKKTLEIIPEITAKSRQTVAFEDTDQGLKVATLNADDLELFDFLSRKTGKQIMVHLADPAAFAQAIRLYHDNLADEIKSLDNPVSNGGKNVDLNHLAEDTPIIKIVDTLIDYAIMEKASDIHIEPTDQEMNIRYRLDGILRKVMTFPKAVHAGLIARIKILSGLKLDEHRLPQDGRFRIIDKDNPVSFRVSIIPTIDGEKIVLRLLPDQTDQLKLEDLGLQPTQLEILKNNIAKTNGMILSTGPTGSGKTTTLYSILSVLNTPEVNISTIEDPIEYHLPGINQCQVQPKIGFTFAAGLRAFLRQDPNIIMVGEIRDNETADIAVNAAMTGHLVISTLHTNDSVTAIPRLIDMQIPAFLLASTLNLVIAQRLVRKICRNCIASYQLDDKTIAELKQQFDLSHLVGRLEKAGYLQPKQDLQSVLFFRGQGCEECNHSGYKGRIGIYELLQIDEDISELITKKASREELLLAATSQGMLTMFQDGFIKAKNGVTTIEEVLRVIKE